MNNELITAVFLLFSITVIVAEAVKQMKHKSIHLTVSAVNMSTCGALYKHTVRQNLIA